MKNVTRKFSIGLALFALVALVVFPAVSFAADMSSETSAAAESVKTVTLPPAPVKPVALSPEATATAPTMVPTIDSTPILAIAPPMIWGSSDPYVTISLYLNGLLAGTTIADYSGSWNFGEAPSLPLLHAGDQIYVTATGAGVTTEPSPIETVVAFIPVHLLTIKPIYAGDKTISGTTDAPAGSLIEIDNNILGAVVATGIVQADGTWVATVLPGMVLKAGDGVNAWAFVLDSNGGIIGWNWGFVGATVLAKKTPEPLPLPKEATPSALPPTGDVSALPIVSVAASAIVIAGAALVSRRRLSA